MSGSIDFSCRAVQTAALLGLRLPSEIPRRKYGEGLLNPTLSTKKTKVPFSLPLLRFETSFYL